MTQDRRPGAKNGLTHDVIATLKIKPMTRAELKNELAYDAEDHKPLADALSRLKREGRIEQREDGRIALVDVPVIDNGNNVITPQACQGCADMAQNVSDKDEIIKSLHEKLAESVGQIKDLRKINAEMDEVFGQAHALLSDNGIMHGHLCTRIAAVICLLDAAREDTSNAKRSVLGYIVTDLHQIHKTEAEAIEHAHRTASQDQRVMVAGVTREGKVPPAQILWERVAA